MFETRNIFCSNQKISCVRIRRFRVFESEDFVCSNQEISCARIRRSRVFQSRHLVCSNEDLSSVPRRTIPRSQTLRFLTPKQNHFSKIHNATFNLGERPGILPNRNLTQKDPGTIVKIGPKVASQIFDVVTPRKKTFWPLHGGRGERPSTVGQPARASPSRVRK